MSLCLALLVMGTWIAFGPLLLYDSSRITFISFGYFGIACVGILLWFLGFYNIRKAVVSWLTKILSIISFLLSGAVLVFATIILFNFPSEVKGTVQSVGDDFVMIYIDNDYKNEYNMDGSQLTTLNEPSTRQSINSGFLVWISQKTIFIKQNGPWIWQRKSVTLSSLQEGQHIQIKHNGWRHLDGSIMEAGEIIILDK